MNDEMQLLEREFTQLDTPLISKRFKPMADLFGIKNRVGFTEEEVRQCEEKHGRLPGLLRAYYLELGAHEALNQTWDSLHSPGKLHGSDERTDPHIVFYMENDLTYLWGIRKDDMSKDNPPVYASPATDEWYPWEDTLEGFLLGMAHRQAVFYYEYSTKRFVYILPEDSDKIRNAFEKIDCRISRSGGPEFFGWHGAVIMLQKDWIGQDTVTYAAPTKIQFDLLDEEMRDLNIYDQSWHVPYQTNVRYNSWEAVGN